MTETEMEVLLCKTQKKCVIIFYLFEKSRTEIAQ